MTVTTFEFERQAARNRARMPRTAEIVEEWRRVFGPGVKVRWASEGGIEVGQRGPTGVPVSPLFVHPSDLLKDKR